MKTKKSAALLLALLILLCGCSGNPKKDPLSEKGEYILSADEFKTDFVCSDQSRVFYEIFVGSFSDSNGDGIGDLRGIIDRFDYLNDGDPNSGLGLGVEGIWLSPIFASPSYHKYDVTDYYKIDETFGTMEDLSELITLCHERNVKLIIDLPINHTSTANLWFTKFQNAHKEGDTQNEFYDFYSWSPASAPGFSSITGTTDYYECNFTGSMPELNFNNPTVKDTVLDIAKFYLDMGIDGFRFDAAKYIYYGKVADNTEFWDWYIGELRKINPDVYTIAEVWDADSVILPYYSSTDCFNFAMSSAEGKIATAAKQGDINIYTSYIESFLSSIKAKRDSAMIVPFISNHDTDRCAGYLTLSSGYMMMAANIYLLGPGSPFIYYGEEIGMRGSRGSSSTDANRRLAMYWGDDDTIKDPYGSTYGGTLNQTNGSVSEQIGNESSLFNHYKKLIMIRNANPEIARGEYKALKLDSRVGGFTSTYEGKTVAVLHNSTISEKQVDLAAIGISEMQIANIVGAGDAKIEGTILTIGAQTSIVMR